MTRLFEAGQIEIGPEARTLLDRNEQDPGAFIDRHTGGDFGELAAADVHENHLAIERRAADDVVYSVFVLADRVTVLWCATTWDSGQPCTVLATPAEYEGL